MSDLTLLTISGALRQGSTNRMLLKQAAHFFGPASVVDADLKLPLYDGDLEDQEGIPVSVQALADQIAAADAIVISSPEYNKGIPGVLKNALDWISRVPGGVFAGKPVAMVSAAAGRAGGETAHYMLRHCLTPLGAQLVPGNVLVASSFDAFDDDGHLKDERYVSALTSLMGTLRSNAITA